MQEIILQTKDLTKTYKYATALDHVNLTLYRGRIYGFVGNNGAGKTTLMRTIMGLTFPDSGELSLFGETGQRNLERSRSRIGALIEQAVGYDYMTARQNMTYRRMISKARAITTLTVCWIGCPFILATWARKPSRTIPWVCVSAMAWRRRFWESRSSWCWMSPPLVLIPPVPVICASSSWN